MMRTTYRRVIFDFGTPRPAEHVGGIPKRIIWHRQGNPGVEGRAGIEYGRSSSTFTIHSYIDDDTSYDAIPPECQAFHTLESRIAAQKGYRTTGAYGVRGDYDSIGIETEDENQQSAKLAPGQVYGLSQETRITLLLRTFDYLKQFPNLTPADVDEHATYDPWQRSEDMGDAINILDAREDLADLLAGRTPWRIVGEFARGTRAPASWKPATTVVLPPAVVPVPVTVTVDPRIAQAVNMVNSARVNIDVASALLTAVSQGKAA